MKVEAAEFSAWFAELPPAVVVADLPASDKPRQLRDAPPVSPEPEATIPVNGSNTDLFNGLTDLDTTFPCLGTPSDSIAVSLSRPSRLFT